MSLAFTFHFVKKKLSMFEFGMRPSCYLCDKFTMGIINLNDVIHVFTNFLWLWENAICFMTYVNLERLKSANLSSNVYMTCKGCTVIARVSMNITRFH